MSLYNKFIPKEPFRIRIYQRFNNLFLDNQSLITCLLNDKVTEHCQKLALNIEKSIFNFTITNLQMRNALLDKNFYMSYIGSAVKLYSNLDPNHSLKNTYLLPELLSGNINPLDVVHFSPDQLFPSKFMEIMKENPLEIIVTGVEDTIEEDYIGMHQCRRCKSWRTTYILIQKRASDEGSAEVITCGNPQCGHKFVCST